LLLEAFFPLVEGGHGDTALCVNCAGQALYI